VENFPGYENIMGPDLIETLRKQVSHFGTEIINENISSVDFSQKPFRLSYGQNAVIATSVIVATGAQALWLGLESEQRLRGRGVSACATCDGFFFRNKKVAIVGGGDTAMEEAQTLTHFASKVYLIHRRDSFRASKIMQERVLSNPKVEVLWNNEVVEVFGEQKVTGLKLKQKVQGSDSLEVDGLFLAIGHKPDTSLFEGKIELDKKGYVMTSSKKAIQLVSEKASVSEVTSFNYHFQTMTSQEGVFAGGDCVDHVYRQASTAAGMGVAAALDTERWIIEQEA
jgi:thioredoxin reductase (NADPH)